MDDSPSVGARESTLVNPRWVIILFSAFLLVWLIQMLVEAIQWTATEDYLFPMLVGVPTLILLVFHIARNLYSDHSTRNGGMEGANSGASAISKREIVLSALVVGFMILIYYSGFAISIPTFLFGTMYYLTRDLRKSLLSTVLVLALIYLLFVEILNMAMWTGALDIALLS